MGYLWKTNQRTPLCTAIFPVTGQRFQRYREMSWDAYVELCLMQKETVSGTIHNCCESAAILSAATADLWAATPNFEFLMDSTDVPSSDFSHSDRIIVNEAESLLYAIKNGGMAPTRAGLYLRGERYMVVRFDEDTSTMYLKKKNGGACVCLTNVTIVVGTYDSKMKVASPPGEAAFPQNAGLTNERVERLATFLRYSGF